MFATNWLTTALLLPFAAAQLYPLGFYPGPAPTKGYETYLIANKNPNASHTVEFQHDAYPPSGAKPAISQNWTWTLSVSDVSVQNVSTKFSDAHIAYTSWEFSWPEQGTLDDALSAEANATVGSGNVPSCVFVYSALFPQKISDAWNADSSDCTSALGSDCVAALKDIIGSTSGFGCDRSIDMSPMRTACASSFGASGDSGYGVSQEGD
jgi:hypothetical protein